MGVLIAPKTGDASIKIIPQMKKHTTISDESSKSFISTISERHAIKQNALIIESNYNSINSMNKDSHNHSVTENTISDEMSNSTIHDSCQFPYYRLIFLLYYYLLFNIFINIIFILSNL